MKKLRNVLLCMVLILATALVGPTQADAKVAINKTAVTMTAGEKITLKVKGTTKKPKWASNDKKIAKVTQKGVVIAKTAGTAKITAKIGAKTYTCKITVQKAAPKTVWLSATGTKYHKIPNCGKMDPQKAIKVSLAYALEQECEPCKKCFGK